MTTEIPQPLITVKGVANHFGVSERLIRNWVSQGRIPQDSYIHINQTYRFDLTAVRAALLSDNDTQLNAVDDGEPWNSLMPSIDDAALTPDTESDGVRVLTEDNIGTWGDMSDDDTVIPDFDTTL